MKQALSSATAIWVILALLGLLFGSAFLCVKVLVGELSTMQVVASRLGLGAVSILAVLAIRGKIRRPSKELLVAGAALGVADAALPYALIVWAQDSIDSGTAAVLMSTMPFFTLVFALLASREERLSPSKIGGLMLGFAGVWVLAGLDLAGGSQAALACLAVIAGAASYGAATVYGRGQTRRHSVVDLTATKLSVAALITCAISLVVDGPPQPGSLSHAAVAALLVLGVLSTGLGRLVFLWTIAVAGSVRASLVTYMLPVSAVVLGWAFLGESVTPGMLGGMALILSGVAVVLCGPQIRSLSWRRRQAGRGAPAPAEAGSVVAKPVTMSR